MSNTSEPIELRWTASEYVEHEKSTMWYVALIVVAAVVSFGAYFLTSGDLIAPISIAVMVIGLGVFAGIKPKQKEYLVDAQGVHIGENTFPYDSFKSFSIVIEGNIEALYLKPNKRLAVPVTLYFPPEMGDGIVDFIGNFVPYEQSELSGVDKITSRLKF